MVLAIFYIGVMVSLAMATYHSVMNSPYFVSVFGGFLLAASLIPILSAS